MSEPTRIDAYRKRSPRDESANDEVVSAIKVMMAKLTPDQWEDQEFTEAAAIVWDAAKK